MGVMEAESGVSVWDVSCSALLVLFTERMFATPASTLEIRELYCTSSQSSARQASPIVSGVLDSFP